MSAFFREAPVGAIILVVLGTVIYFSMVPFQAFQEAREANLRKKGLRPDERDAEARRQVFFVRFIGGGCILSGFGWYLIS